MQDVVYVGSSDYRVLGPSDFSKSGIDHPELTFRRGVPTEVSDALAKKLIAHDVFRAEFVIAGDEPEGFVPPSAGDLIPTQNAPSTYGIDVNWETIKGLQGQEYRNGQPVQEVTDPVEAYDPSGYNVDEVVAYLNDHPDDAERVIKLEQDGKKRVTVTGWEPVQVDDDPSGDSGAS